MTKTVIINSSHFVKNSGNQYTYVFPSSKRFTVGSGIGVCGIAVYNSVFNITSVRQNNSIVFIFLGVSYTFTIPDGYYSIFNYFLQSQFILNGLYLTANDGSDNMYFAELLINTVRYSTSLNFYVIPTESDALSLGYSKPANSSWSYPVSQRTPSLTFSSAFG
jgi:hypothetical protein